MAKSDYRFAVIPEWVLYAPISAQAVRLFGVLARHANSDGRAWPSRRTLAERLGVSVKSVDRALQELQGCGAVAVKHRRNPSGDLTSSEYLLPATQPLGTAMTGGTDKCDDTGGDKFDDTGGVIDDALTKASINDSQGEREPLNETTAAATARARAKSPAAKSALPTTGPTGAAEAVFRHLAQRYEAEIGRISELWADKAGPWVELLAGQLELIPAVAVLDYALSEAVTHNARNWAYVESVLRQVEQAGWSLDRHQQNREAEHARRVPQPTRAAANGRQETGGEPSIYDFHACGATLDIDDHAYYVWTRPPGNPAEWDFTIELPGRYHRVRAVVGQRIPCRENSERERHERTG